MPSTPSLPHDHLAIQNTLARYCQALDTKSWALLHDVFLPDVIADYPFNRDLRGSEAVAKAIQGRYVRLPTLFPYHPASPRSRTFASR